MATVIAAPARLAGALGWLSQLDPADARYPRPRWYAALHWGARLWWIPVSVYAGNLASNLLMRAARGGFSLSGLASYAVHNDAVAALIPRAPVFAALVGLLLLALALIGRRIYQDQRREAAVLKLRAMRQVMESRDRRTQSAQILQREIAALQSEIAALVGWLAPDSAPAVAPEGVRARVERLAEACARLGEDYESQWMSGDLIEREMRAWEREQRIFAVILGAATLLAGWLIPLLAASGAIA